MERKIDKLRQMMANEDWRGALKLAAAWPRLGVHRDAIRRGWAAAANPGFYAEIGEDPDQLVAAGIAALQERYAG